MENTGKLFPEDLLKQIRDRFFFTDSDPLSGKRIWLESASGSLKLKSMIDVLADRTQFADQLGRANPGSRHAGEVSAKGIEDVRLFLGAKSGVIMPAMSSTHAVFRAVHAVMENVHGGNVVTTDLDHPSVYDSTRRFADIYGKEWRAAHLDPQSGAVKAEAILQKVDKDTRLVAMIHGSNITGSVLDVKTVAREARKINPDVYVLADGVQYVPHAPIDVEDMGVDAYVYGPYKAFCVRGIGFCYLSSRLAGLPHWRLAGKSDDDWDLGSAEEATYAAWSAVTDYICWLGGNFTESTNRRAQIVSAMEASEAHLQALLDRLVYGNGKLAGLSDMKHVNLHGMGDNTAGRLCLVLFELAGMDSYQAVELYNRAGLRLHNRTRDTYSKHTLDAMGISEGVRLSACHYNTPKEIDRFLEVTAELGAISDAKISELGAGPSAGRHGEG